MYRTYFFKNLTNIAELKYKTEQKNNSHNTQRYEVIKTIHIGVESYQEFCQNFKYNYDFLFPYIEQMKIDSSIWKCILVTCIGEEGILVCNNGYLFPCFTALPAQF